VGPLFSDSPSQRPSYSNLLTAFYEGLLLPLAVYSKTFLQLINWIGLTRFRSPLLTSTLLIFFPLGTEMFHFPKFSSSQIFSRRLKGCRLSLSLNFACRVLLSDSKISSWECTYLYFPFFSILRTGFEPALMP
jgi:hypothetical protein